MHKRGRLLSIKHLFKYLGASTSIEVGNNNKIDNGVKKETINDEADKSDLEKSQEAAFCRWRSSGLFARLVGSGGNWLNW